MARLIIEDVVVKMETLIAGIRVGDMASNDSDGANFDWNPCNVFDDNLRKEGPNADIYLRDESDMPEEGGDQGGLYGNLLAFDIEIHFKYRTPPANPTRQAQIDLFKALDDLKRLFGREHSLGDSGAFHIERNGKAIIEYTQLQDRPGKLVSPWKVTYWQHRNNPDLAGG